MGAKKSKKSKKSSGGVLGKVKSAIGAKLSGGKRVGGGRRRRTTPESLARKILILKLKKKYFKLKYGGR